MAGRRRTTSSRALPTCGTGGNGDAIVVIFVRADGLGGSAPSFLLSVVGGRRAAAHRMRRERDGSRVEVGTIRSSKRVAPLARMFVTNQTGDKIRPISNRIQISADRLEGNRRSK